MAGFYADEDETAALLRAAKSRGLSVADFLRSVIKENDPEAHAAAKGSSDGKKR